MTSLLPLTHWLLAFHFLSKFPQFFLFFLPFIFQFLSEYSVFSPQLSPVLEGIHYSPIWPGRLSFLNSNSWNLSRYLSQLFPIILHEKARMLSFFICVLNVNVDNVLQLLGEGNNQFFNVPSTVCLSLPLIFETKKVFRIFLSRIVVIITG